MSKNPIEIIFLIFNVRRCSGTRIRVEMSSGRSRRDDRKRGGAGGNASGGRNRYRYVSIVYLMNFQWNHKQIYEHKIHLSYERTNS